MCRTGLCTGSCPVDAGELTNRWGGGVLIKRDNKQGSVASSW